VKMCNQCGAAVKVAWKHLSSVPGASAERVHQTSGADPSTPRNLRVKVLILHVHKHKPHQQIRKARGGFELQCRLESSVTGLFRAWFCLSLG
jgi:hypothetical protein